MKHFRYLLLSLITTAAFAQTVPNGGITQGQIWSVPQWLTAWQSKADTASPVFTGSVTANGVSQAGANWIITNPFTYGNFNTAVGCSFVADSSHAAQVMGWVTDSGQATYPTRDAVGCYFDITAPSPVVSAAAGTFTTTSFTPTTPFSIGQVAQFRVGMFVITQEASTFFSGKITAWATNGTSITVSGWYQQGNTGAGQTPTGGDTVTINPVTKVWALNANLIFPASGSIATAGAGIELGLQDNSATAATNTTWGYDSVNLTATAGRDAFMARGPWDYDYQATTGSTAAFYYNPSGTPTNGFLSSQTSGNGFFCNQAMSSGFCFRSLNFDVVGSTGQMDLGSQTGSQANETILFHDSGHAGGDVAIASSGGTGINDGTLAVAAGAVNVTAPTVTTVATTTCLSALSACGNEALRATSVASQVNQVRVTGAITGSGPSIAATGADGNVNLNITAKGSGGVISLQSIATLPSFTVAGLPGCSATFKGGLAYVTDATAPTYNAALTGGGAVIVPVFCNGTAWTSH